MKNSFLKDINEYKIKCDKYISEGKCLEFFDSFGVTDVMKKYFDAFIDASEGGKRIRAYLVYLGYCLYKGIQDNSPVFVPSISFELFQTGILAHDDIIDNSDFRRFKPSMHMALGGGHSGISKSICTGDFGIVAATQIVNESDFSDSVKLKAITHLNNVFASTIAGELKDVEFSEMSEVPEKDILDMYRLKTAQYTLSGPLVLGGIFAEVPDDELLKLKEFGDSVGISFQIRDDILGMFADEVKVGKSVTSDMCEGKQTILTAHFLKNADKSLLDEFSNIYGKPDCDLKELEKARELLIKAGSLEYANSVCVSYVEKAEKILNELSISDEDKVLLKELLEYMTVRNS